MIFDEQAKQAAAVAYEAARAKWKNKVDSIDAALQAALDSMKERGLVATERAMLSESGTATLAYLDKVFFPEGTAVIIAKVQP